MEVSFNLLDHIVADLSVLSLGFGLGPSVLHFVFESVFTQVEYCSAGSGGEFS